jgi:ribosomal subunit interface protein
MVSIGVTLSIVSRDNNLPEVTMQIEIQARNFSTTRAMREHVERRLGFALSSCYRHVKRILVRLSDINGPRGGNDKRCHIEVILPGQAAVVVEDTESDLYVAINRAASRASRTVMRRLGRRRNRKRLNSSADRLLADSIDEIPAY